MYYFCGCNIINRKKTIIIISYYVGPSYTYINVRIFDDSGYYGIVIFVRFGYREKTK